MPYFRLGPASAEGRARVSLGHHRAPKPIPTGTAVSLKILNPPIPSKPNYNNPTLVKTTWAQNHSPGHGQDFAKGGHLMGHGCGSFLQETPWPKPNETGCAPEVLVQAVAEQFVKQQTTYQEAVMTFLQAMRDTQALFPIAYYWKHKYDETPLKMRGHFGDSQVAKLHVVEASWGCLLRLPQQGEGEAGPADEEEPRARAARRFVFWCGELAPQCRIVDSGSAEGVAAIIESTLLPQDRVPSLVPHPIRLIETDSLGANKKAERMMQTSRKWRGWTHLSWYCVAHRIHQAFTRSVTFYKPLTSGLSQIALLMCHTPGNLPKARRLLVELVEEKFVYVRGGGELSLAAEHFKQRCIQLFAAPHAMPFLFLVGAFILNGDWRDAHEITHRCGGCCADRQHALAKAQQAVLKILSLAPPKMMSKANWLEWNKAAQFMGIMGSIHHMGRELLQRLLGVATEAQRQRDDVDQGAPPPAADGQAAAPEGAAPGLAAAPPAPAHAGGEAENVNVGNIGEDLELQQQGALRVELRLPPPGNLEGMPEMYPAQAGGQHEDGDLDELAALRKLEEQRKTDVITFLQVPMMWDMLVVLMQSLKPEVHLMQKTLQLAGVKWTLREMVKMQEGGTRDYSLQLLSSEPFYCGFMTASMGMLRAPQNWNHVIPSEMLATKQVLTVLRMVSVVYELCVLASRRFPERLFKLVGAEADIRAAIALDIVEAPGCVKDQFCLWFLSLYPTVEALQSAESLATLTAVMHMSDGHTLSTERAHSRNLRCSKQRVQTHKIDLPWLASQQQHSATPPWAFEVQHTARPRATEAKPRARKRKRRQEQDAVGMQNGPDLPVPDAEHGCAAAGREGGRGDEGHEGRRVKKRGAGGAWRAYLHGTGQKACAAAARGYRSLSEESRAFFVELGRQGTAAARTGIMAFGGVGVGAQRPGQAEAAQLPEDANAFVFKPRPHNNMLFTTPLCMRQKKDVETLCQLLQQGRREQEAAQSVEEEHMCQLQRMVHMFGDSFRRPAQPYSLEVLSKLCSSWKKARTKTQRAHDADAGGRSDKQKLIAYNEQSLERLQGLYPHMAGVTHISFPAFCPAVSSSMSCSASPPQSNFQTLSDDWVKRHSGVLASSVAEKYAGGNYKATPQSTCRTAGKCVCRGAGKVHRSMAFKIDGLLKQWFPRGPARQEKLVGGLVVLSFSVAPDDGDEGEAAPDHICSLFAHVSLMYLSPWRATLTLLEKKDEGSFTVQSDPNGWPACRTMLDLVSAMRVDKAWSLQVLLVDAHRDSTIAAEDFCTLRAAACEKPAEVFWRGERAERRQRGDALWDIDLAEAAEPDHNSVSDGEAADDDPDPLTPQSSSGTASCICRAPTAKPSRVTRV